MQPSSCRKQRGGGAAAVTAEEKGAAEAGPGAPCGACKFLRRRCAPGCVFAPHFGGGGGGGAGGRERGAGAAGAGAAQFAAVHRVFGASNVAKLLSRVPLALRRDAARTVCYEAQARIADPVYGSVGTILALQHQVALLQGQLSVLQTQLFNCRLALASGGAAARPDELERFVVLQPAYSAASAPSSQAAAVAVNYDELPQAVDFMDVEHQMRGLEYLQLSYAHSQPPPPREVEDKSQSMDLFSDNVGQR